MMTVKAGFTNKDAVVAFGCVVLLLMTLGAAGSGGRRRAKEAVCLSNLHQWGTVFAMDVQENQGYFYSGEGSMGFWWVKDLKHRYKDWKNMKIWFCPEATKPVIDENGIATPTLSIFTAWGIFNGEGLGPNGISGSYGLNAYVLNTPGAENNWRTPDAQGAEKIPVFLDALRFDLWPKHTDQPAAYEFAAWAGSHMARCCINRHNGAVNCLFLDWSARKVGLKELWTLKWHRQFNTAGPWTKAGGVRPEDWPEWMRNFKEY
jgi:prepilin-type processing-associated H-X9-DG protein